jgi:hypothetical protein
MDSLPFKVFQDSLGFTALLPNAKKRDSIPSVQFWGKTERQAIDKLKQWATKKRIAIHQSNT